MKPKEEPGLEDRTEYMIQNSQSHDSAQRVLVLKRAEQQAQKSLKEIKKLETELKKTIEDVSPRKGLLERGSHFMKRLGDKIVTGEEAVRIYNQIESELTTAVNNLNRQIKDIFSSYQEEELKLEAVKTFAKSDPQYEQVRAFLESETGLSIDSEVADFLRYCKERTPDYEPGAVLEKIVVLREGVLQACKGIAVASTMALGRSIEDLGIYTALKPSFILLALGAKEINYSTELSEAVRNFSEKAIPAYKNHAINSIRNIRLQEEAWKETCHQIKSQEFDPAKVLEEKYD